MSDFWSRALGGASAPAPRVPAQPQPDNQPWWKASFLPPSTPAPQQQTVVQNVPQPSAPVPSKAISARSTDYCPNCGTTNYFRPHGVPNAMLQCYECGYNSRFEQSGGAGLPSDSSAPAQPARQVSTANNFNPTVIVAKVQ